MRGRTDGVPFNGRRSRLWVNFEAPAEMALEKLSGRQWPVGRVGGFGGTVGRCPSFTPRGFTNCRNFGSPPPLPFGNSRQTTPRKMAIVVAAIAAGVRKATQPVRLRLTVCEGVSSVSAGVHPTDWVAARPHTGG